MQKLPALPPRVARLPVDSRGFPVPWFVAWLRLGEPSNPGTGVPDFRVVDTRKLVRAVADNLCWVCGDRLGKHLAFVIGPMCAINRVISEPPSHRDCAIFSATACPFLSRPRMRRNERDMPPVTVPAAGMHISRNPGAVCVWITDRYRPFKVAGGGVLFQLGEPHETLWFAEGRAATREEVLASINSGYPLLYDMARAEGAAAITALERQREHALRLLPEV